MKRAIIIMAKSPSAGGVESRLQPFLSASESAELAETFVKDAAGKVKNVCDNVILAYLPDEEINALKKSLPLETSFISLTGADQGEKILNAFRFAFERKADLAVMIGADSPTFPADYIEQAFEFLELETDIVLGKTESGGFYLIGLRAPDERIFDGVDWNAVETFEQVFENAHRLGVHLREVPSWYDVKGAADFEKLRTEILHNENARRRAPETFSLIKRWEKF
jgi:glycosyltransferase A (GT-A) superfamily protein (DUF2064 family)